MESNAGHSRFRVVGIRPWASEHTDTAPSELRTFFEGQEGDVDDLRTLTASFGAEFTSMVQGGNRDQAAITWRGHRYDLDLEPLR